MHHMYVHVLNLIVFKQTCLCEYLAKQPTKSREKRKRSISESDGMYIVTYIFSKLLIMYFNLYGKWPIYVTCMKYHKK